MVRGATGSGGERNSERMRLLQRHEGCEAVYETRLHATNTCISFRLDTDRQQHHRRRRGQNPPQMGTVLNVHVGDKLTTRNNTGSSTSCRC